MDDQQNGQNNPQPLPTTSEADNNETVVQLQHDNPPITQTQPLTDAPLDNVLPPQPIAEPQQQSATSTIPEQTPQDEKPQLQYQSGNLQQTGQIGQPETQKEEQETKTGDSVSWSASEFIHHDKSGGWHFIVMIGVIILAAGIYFLTKSIFGAVVIVVVGIIFSIFGSLKPKILDYAITPQGIQVGEKHFDYLLFSSFAVIEEAQTPSLQLMPQKRFAVPITIYFAPADADRIVDTLGEYLPFEHRERDFVDKLSSRIRF